MDFPMEIIAHTCYRQVIYWRTCLPCTSRNWCLWTLVDGMCADQTAKIWDLMAGVEARSLDGHPASVVSVKYSSASQLIYTASAYLVTVWDPRRARCVHTLTSVSRCCLSICLTVKYKNSSGDEIANVNFYAVYPEATRIRWNNAK